MAHATCHTVVNPPVLQAFVAEATVAGASRLEINGRAISGKVTPKMNATIAGRFGFNFEHIGSGADYRLTKHFQVNVNVIRLTNRLPTRLR